MGARGLRRALYEGRPGEDVGRLPHPATGGTQVARIAEMQVVREAVVGGDDACAGGQRRVEFGIRAAREFIRGFQYHSPPL